MVSLDHITLRCHCSHWIQGTQQFTLSFLVLQRIVATNATECHRHLHNCISHNLGKGAGVLREQVSKTDWLAFQPASSGYLPLWRFLNLSTTDVWGVLFFVVDGCPVHCRTPGIHGLYPLDARISSHFPLPVWQPKMSPDITRLRWRTKLPLVHNHGSSKELLVLQLPWVRITFRSKL